MQKINRTLSRLPELQIFAVDWVMVVVGIFWSLLLWTYGATSWQKIILGGGTALWWIVGNWWVRARQKQTKKPEFILAQMSRRWSSWWLLWLGCVVSNVFTSQIPLQSSVMIFWWIMCALWFWWWSSLANSKLRNWLVTQMLCGSLLILVLASWLTAWFHPGFIMFSLLEISPNYLVPFFGHHHIAALIVLIWPLWWLVKEWLPLRTQQQHWSLVLWLAVLGGTVWFSFSRSAWLAILLQTGGFFWLQRKVIQKNLAVWALAGGVLVMLLVAGFLLKDLMQSQPFIDLPKPIRQFCYQWWAPDSLCGVAPEPRLQYWRQTIAVWQQLPWFGSGLDTFGQVARRWQTNTLFQTQYPHQVFLQVLSEQGVFGLIIWLGFFGLLFFDLWQHLRQKTAEKNWPFFLAIFGGLLIGNLDFDWQLAGFWWAFVMLISCVVVDTKTKVSPRWFESWLLRVGLMIGLSGAVVSALTYVVLITNRADQWVKILPYSAEWQSLTAQKLQNREVWHRIVQQHYRQSPDVWFGAMTDIHDPIERWLWLEQLWQLDPLRYWETNPLAIARQNQDLTQIALVLNRLDQWITDFPESKVRKYNSAFAAELFELADQSLRQENWQVAEKALKLAQIFDPWVLHNNLPTIAQTQQASEKNLGLLRTFVKLDQTGYGDNLPIYRLWFRQLVTAETDRLLQQRVNRVGNTPISSLWLPIPLEGLSDWSDSVAELALQSFVLLPDPQSRGVKLSEKLSGLLIEAGDSTVGTSHNRVSEFYQLAQKIEPWSMNGKLWWFERMRLIKPTTAEFLSFAADWSHAPAETTGYKPHAWILFYNRVLLLSLRSGNYSAAFESLEAVKHYWSQAAF